ncbi:MAG: hypothetical protein ACP5M4_13385 [Acidobacteriaceae bacterium]
MVAAAFGTFGAQAQKSTNANSAAGGLRYLSPGMPPVMIQPVVGAAAIAPAGVKSAHGAGKNSTNLNLFYNGGTSGIGVQTAPKVYLVFWGSQWNNNDPSGEAAILVNFLKSVGGSSWSNTDTQYCEGVASGTYICGGAGTPAGNNIVFGGAWYDNTSAAPTNPTQADIAAEAVNAATFFGNTATGSNANTQYIIATPNGDSTVGFGTQFCAFHSFTTPSSGNNISYTDFPYITDAGAFCGANFNGLGPNAGITIVEGQELTESITDPFPGTGWQNVNYQEISDLCAWTTSGKTAVANVVFPDGQIFPVQPLWSNAYHHDKGGCVMSY